MPHVDDGTLHALLDGALRAEEPGRAERVAAHLETCADCRARLEQAAALKDEAAQILDTLETAHREAGSPGPDFHEVLARAQARAGDVGPDGAPTGAGDRPAGPGRSLDRAAVMRRYRWTRGLAWAATVVIALGTGYVVRDLAGPGPEPRTATRRAVPAEARGDTTEATADRDRPAVSASSPAQPPATAQLPDREQSAQRQRTEAERPAPPAQGAGPAPEGVSPAGETEAPAPLAEAPEQEAAAAPLRLGEAEAEAIALEQIVVTGLAGGATEERWVPASPEEAEARVGPILILPGARIAGTELSGDGGTVRTLQLLPGDVEIRVVQAAADSGAVAAGEGERQVGEAAEPAPSPRARSATDEADRGRTPEQPRPALVSQPADAPALVQLRLDSVAETVSEPSTVSVTRDGTTLTLTGRLTPELLRALAALAAPGSD